MTVQPFSAAKSKVRELNLRAMIDCLGEQKNGWAYFGLPSPAMEDVLVWRDYLRSVDAVERGIPGREWKGQHDVARTAVLNGIRGFRRHSGDIDDIIISKASISWEFDVVNLDYTGGITYRDTNERSKRIEAIRSLIKKQGESSRSFFLCITVNDRPDDRGEIKDVINDLERICSRRDPTTAEIVRKALQNGDRRLVIFFYTAYVVLVAAQPWFKSRAFKPIFYSGRGQYKMVNMAFCLKIISNRDAPVGETFDLAKIPLISPLLLSETDVLQ
jgi:hypothetical protein